MNSSSSPSLKNTKNVPIKIPSVPNNFSTTMQSGDSIRKSVNGFNKGIGAGFNANGELSLPIYSNEIPEGKSAFVSIYDAPPVVGVDTPLAYYWRNLVKYSEGLPANIEDVIWFFIVNPPLFDVVDTNITTFQNQNPSPTDVAWGLFPLFSPACLIFIIQGELFTTNAAFSSFV